MAVQYAIDLQLGTVFTEVTGVVIGAQLYDHQNKLRDDPDFKPDMRELMDCRKLETVKLNTVFNAHLVTSSPWQRSAKRAIVAPSMVAFGLLRIFQTIMSDEHGDISIFCNMQSAKAWLIVQKER